MIENSCLFLKPQVRPEDDRSQKRAIDTFIGKAIKEAGLTSLANGFEGVVVNNISLDLIKKAYDAHILVIDANCYARDSLFAFSPCLYYFMALGHLRGNNTILMAEAENAEHYLPSKLKEYVLTYSYSAVDMWEPIEQFKAMVKNIRQQSNMPDNPIQDYLAKKTLAETRAILEKTQAEAEALKAELNRTRQRGTQPSGRITFHKIKDGQEERNNA